MREGQNPAKFMDSITKPERVTVALLTYIPFLAGYYADYLDVFKICLGSLLANTTPPFDLMVFDNGSGAETVAYLKSLHVEGRIQFLLLSEKNLGKGGAWNIIFETCPGEVLAYADSDVLFSPGWLNQSIRILETYPDVGMVTSRPFRTPPDYYTQTVAWAEGAEEIEIKKGQLIPWETFREFDMSLGQGEQDILERYKSTQDIRLIYRGVEAQVGASHWQFVAWKSVLQRFTPFNMNRPMGQVRELDRRVNDANLLRLMTPDPLTMNMSNTLKEIPASIVSLPTPSSKRTFRERILSFAPLKWALLFIYNRIFRWYYSNK
jgi:glycosyltransferase involved in cell wall biosynthesis